MARIKRSAATAAITNSSTVLLTPSNFNADDDSAMTSKGRRIPSGAREGAGGGAQRPQSTPALDGALEVLARSKFPQQTPPEEPRGERADHQPLGEADPHRAPPQVHAAADGLDDQGGYDIAGDRGQ